MQRILLYNRLFKQEVVLFVDVHMIDHAFNEVYDATYRRTAAYLTAKCRRLSDVEDLLQETYLAVYRILAEKGRAALENPEAYVISVAKTKFIDWYRKEKSNSENLAIPPQPEEYTPSTEPEDLTPTPEEAYLDCETIAELEHLLRSKNEQTRQAFYLHYCFGFSFPEIGKLQNRGESTVRSGVFRVVQEIRAALERRTV